MNNLKLAQEFQLYAENLWVQYWMRTLRYLERLSNELSEKLNKDSVNSYTFQDVLNILNLIDTLAGFEKGDSFEYEFLHLMDVFQSNHLKYRYFLRCRHVHNVVQKELLENINPQLELDSTAEFENKHLHLLVQIMLQFPRMWGDPWSPDWESKK